MKKRISDLLDACGDPGLELNMDTPLSAERIKELTMSKIKKKEIKPRRIAFRVLVVAVIAGTLVLSVLAADVLFGAGEWFQTFFTQEQGQELSAEQIALIEKNAVLIDDRKTVGGYTIHVESAMNAGNTLYIKLGLYAPEGVVIPYGEDFQFERISLLVHGKEQPWEVWGYSELDEDKTDNHIGIIMQIRLAEDTDWSFLFKGEGVVLQMTNLRKSHGSFFDRRTEQLAEGTWEFDLQFDITQEDLWMLEVIREPVPCMMVKNATDNETEIILTSVCLRTLTIDVVYDYPDGADMEQLNWLGMKVIKKDGTSINVLPSNGTIYPEGDKVTGYMSLEAMAPIVPNEVACIQFPDGTQIPVNPTK